MRFSTFFWLVQVSNCLARTEPTKLTKRVTTTSRYVTAHYIAGNGASYTTSDWQDDLTKAQTAGIDAFGLDIAYEDPNTASILSTAFSAAEAMSDRTIGLYLIFDFESWGTWEEDSLIDYINEYKDSSAYFYYDDKPFVSTFEGTGNVTNWSYIRSETGCFAVPDWTSLGVSGAVTDATYVDGLASWEAWPDGLTNLSTTDDQDYMNGLGDKPYMMPVSPWFYTNLPDYDKNWLWYSDSLWHLRWLEAISLGPALVQIISWNDYGESHYIGPIRDSGIPSGAWYVDSDHDHTAWTVLLPYYIAAYKAGSTSVLSSAPTDGVERLVYWYKTNPDASGSTDGTTGNDGAYQTTYAPSYLSDDNIEFSVYLNSAANISVSVGSSTTETADSVLAGSEGLNHFSVALPSGQTGTVRFWVIRDGNVAMVVDGSSDITDDCVDGYVNWNPVVGSSETSFD